MSMFGKILSKLGFGKKKEEEAKAKVSAEKSKQAAEHAVRIAKLRATRKEEKLTETTMVDVMSKLEKMAAENPAELNWRTSIVDLLKLLDIDSSYESRVELAKELGAPEDTMDESAKMNTWLHKAVLIEIAENGGNVPLELLD